MRLCSADVCPPRDDGGDPALLPGETDRSGDVGGSKLAGDVPLESAPGTAGSAVLELAAGSLFLVFFFGISLQFATPKGSSLPCSLNLACAVNVVVFAFSFKEEIDYSVV